MEEGFVDPNYEYEAPQFVDFELPVDMDNENADSWFESNPGYEGGVPVVMPEEAEAEPDKDSAATDGVLEQDSKKDVVDSIKIDLFKDNDGSKDKEIMSEEKEIVLDKVGKSEEIIPEPDDSKSKTNTNEISNGDGNESKQMLSLLGQIQTKKAPLTNIVTSWDHIKKEPKVYRDDTGISGKKDKDQTDKKDDSNRVTRAQKRNNVSNVSVSSGVSNKKQKELPEHQGNGGKAKGTRLLCSNPEKNIPSLTIATTPQCLKREKPGKPAMIKLKTTEEMEMERIAALRKTTKQHMKANKNWMKKAISSRSYHPVRTISTDLTRPQEFHFQTDKRVKPHPMKTRADDAEKEFLKSLRNHPPSPTWKKGVTVPKPFNLSDGGAQTKRKRSLVEKDAVADSYETIAYQVYKFQTTTPPRFRTKKANETNSKTETEHGEKTATQLTCPKTPNLATGARARPVPQDVLSREEKEQKEAEEMKSLDADCEISSNNSMLEESLERTTACDWEDMLRYQFKARPFDRRIVEGDGLFGVKKPEGQKQLTEAVAFNFESDERIELRKQEKKPDNQKEETAQFKALPQPNFEKVFRPQLKHERTAPKPFSFDEKDKERWQKKESKIQGIYKEEEKLREFKAQPLPPDSPDILPAITSKSCTSVKPFNLHTENRGADKADKWRQKVQAELHESRNKVAFKANPNKVVHEAPFLPQKSQRPLTEVSEFALNTNRRAERWEEIETNKKEREHVNDEVRKERDAEREKEEKEAIALLRKQLVHKAQPIHKYKKVIVKPSDKPLTEAVSPAWSETKRRRIDNIR